MFEIVFWIIGLALFGSGAEPAEPTPPQGENTCWRGGIVPNC